MRGWDGNGEHFLGGVSTEDVPEEGKSRVCGELEGGEGVQIPSPRTSWALKALSQGGMKSC